MANKVSKKKVAKTQSGDSEMKLMDKLLAKAQGSAELPKNADALDRMKYALCEEFVKYCVDHNLTQRGLAEQLKVSESRVSEIVRFRIDRLTTDRLIKYLGKLNLKYTLELAA
jgi:predicted XRE-type DNA-binding protein